MSISLQQEPYAPVPAFTSLVDAVQLTELAYVNVNHYPVSIFEQTNLSVDELDVLRTLSITVSGTILGTGLVARVLGHSSIGIHLSEVQSTVQSARKV
jgi:hypothetical protein